MGISCGKAKMPASLSLVLTAITEPSALTCTPFKWVFHAEPLKVAAPSREVWVAEHLSRWKDFSRSEPRLHDVCGTHYTMIGPEYVARFSEKLQAALNSRGI